MSRLEEAIRRTANRFGFDIHRLHPHATHEGRLAQMLAYHQIETVLDVGANTGQFAMSLRAAGYGRTIISFEPLARAHATLLAASSRDTHWIVAPRAAVGADCGQIEIHVAGNSVSSSILPMLNSHRDAAPSSAYVGVEHVPMSTLDELSAGLVDPASRVFLKIDTQGYEDRVIRGAASLMGQVIGIQLESSLVPLYEGQRSHQELIAVLEAHGFCTWGLAPGFSDPRTGRVLQVDTVMFRE